MSYKLPVNGHHLRFPTYSDVGQSSHQSIRIAHPENKGIALEISLLTCIKAEIYVISSLLPVNGRHYCFVTYTDVGQSSHQSLRSCPSSKTWVQPFEFRCYHVYELSYKLFPVYFWLRAAIFDFQHTQTWDSIPTSLSVMPDPEKMDIAVGISLLSCVRAELYVIACLVTVNVHHLRFTTYKNVGQYSHKSLCVARSKKHACSR